MYKLHEWLQREVDKVLTAAGLLIGAGVPAILLHQRDAKASMRAMGMVGEPFPGFFVAIAFFVVWGLAAVIVGVRGCAGHYSSLEERRVSLLRTAGAIGGTLLLGYVVVQCWIAAAGLVSSWSQTTDSAPSAGGSGSSTVDFIRCAVAAVGAMAGLHVATLRPPPDDRKMFWFAILGGLAAWCLAYTIFSIFVAVAIGFILLKFVRPMVQQLVEQKRLSRQQQLAITATGPPQVDSRIEDLRRQIEWTRQSGAPAPYQREEIARLEAQIRQLGGTP